MIEVAFFSKIVGLVDCYPKCITPKFYIATSKKKFGVKNAPKKDQVEITEISNCSSAT